MRFNVPVELTKISRVGIHFVTTSAQGTILYKLETNCLQGMTYISPHAKNVFDYQHLFFIVFNMLWAFPELDFVQF